MQEDRTRFSTGSRFEAAFGYCRAIRVGPHVWVSGCTAADENGQVHGETVVEQAGTCLDAVVTALGEVGAGVEDIVRTRVFTTDVSAWPEVGEKHREAFRGVPTSTIVEVSALARGDLLVEIEADAYVSALT